MDLELGGKRALVTGGSKGIGKAIALVLAQEGVDVALLARDRAALSAAAAELSTQTGRKVVGVSANTTSDDQVRHAVVEAERLLGGKIDILVNAAAEPAGVARPRRPGSTAPRWEPPAADRNRVFPPARRRTGRRPAER